MDEKKYAEGLKTELISIIAPVYQVEDYLRGCLDSVLAQTYPHWELILVDDGTKDSSGAICDEYALKDPRIRVIHKPNGGVSSARNRGIAEAKGEYIAFIDSDDQIKPDYLEVLYRDMVEHQVDVVCCNCVGTEEAAEHFKKLLLVKEPRTIRNKTQFFDDMGSKKELYWSNVWGKLCRTSFVRRCEFRSMRYGEDVLFVYDLLSLGPAVYLDPYEGYYYVIRGGSAMSSSGALNEARFADELRMDYHRWKNLPEVSMETFRRMLNEFANRLHRLAYAQAVHGGTAYDGLIREKTAEALAHREHLRPDLLRNLMLLDRAPWLYRLLIRTKRRIRGEK